MKRRGEKRVLRRSPHQSERSLTLKPPRARGSGEQHGEERAALPHEETSAANFLAYIHTPRRQHPGLRHPPLE